MERIRQSFRRKKNKHKNANEIDNNFDAQNVFESVADGDEAPKPLTRIQKIRHSIRKLKKKKKETVKDDEPAVDDFDVVDDNFIVENNEEEVDDKDDEFTIKDEIEDDVPEGVSGAGPFARGADVVGKS